MESARLSPYARSQEKTHPQCQTTKPKKLKRLYDRGPELRRKLTESYLANNKEVKKLKGLIAKLKG